MKGLFLVLALLAGLFFLVLPLGAALGYGAALGWTGWMLYLIFYRRDALSQALAEQE